MSYDTFDHGYYRSAYHGDYDLRNPARKAAFYLSQIAAVQPGGRLPDVGCAFGSFLAVAGERYEVAGIDVSLDAVEVARTRLPGVRISRASVLELDGAHEFDVVTCFDTLEHVTPLDEALTALRGAMAPKGVLAVTVPVFDGLTGGVVRHLDHDATHVWRQGRDFWRKKLEDHGLDVVRSVGLWRYLLPWRAYLFFGSRLLYRLSPAVMLIGRDG
ncbi:MAG: class I SAM-dependent methyltransferase [Thermoanaerobaculaceae bacterium]|nr:class I SAM-dependent methyltransferase [Thermoanaerobaculaceae bacterium]